MPQCPHGMEIGPQAAIKDIESWKGIGNENQILEFYSACDCCDFLMHKSCAGMEPPNGYKVMDDGRTLCAQCQEERKEGE